MNDYEDDYDVPIHSIVPVSRRPFIPFTPYSPNLNTLSEIAHQDPDGALDYLYHNRRVDREELRIREKAETQRCLINSETALGVAFITHRFPGERHCDITYDNDVRDGISDGFFGGSSANRTKGKFSINIY